MNTYYTFQTAEGTIRVFDFSCLQTHMREAAKEGILYNAYRIFRSCACQEYQAQLLNGIYGHEPLGLL